MAKVKDLHVERFQDLYSKSNDDIRVSNIESEQEIDFVRSTSVTPLPEVNDQWDQTAAISLTTIETETRQILNVGSTNVDHESCVTKHVD